MNNHPQAVKTQQEVDVYIRINGSLSYTKVITFSGINSPVITFKSSEFELTSDIKLTQEDREHLAKQWAEAIGINLKRDD